MSIFTEALADADDYIQDTASDIIDTVVDSVKDTIDWLAADFILAVKELVGDLGVIVSYTWEVIKAVRDVLAAVWEDLPQWVKIAIVVTGLIAVMVVTGTAWIIGQTVMWVAGMVGPTYQYIVLILGIWGSDIAQAIRHLLHFTSQDYRDFETKVYGWVSEAANYIGVSADFLKVMIHDISVLTTSTMAVFGFDYEVGKIQSVVTTSAYLESFAEQMDIYKEDPNQIFIDADAWVIKPLVDMKAGFQKDFLLTVDKFGKTVGETASNVAQVTRDVDRLVHDLPERIGKDIWDDVEPYITKVQDRIREEIMPAVEILNASVDVLQGGQLQHEYKIKNMRKTLFNPGYLLRNVDELDKEEREKQENIIGLISRRGSVRALKEANEKIKAEREGLEEQYQESVKVGKVTKPEYIKPIKVIEKEPEPLVINTSWFVGDF